MSLEVKKHKITLFSLMLILINKTLCQAGMGNIISLAKVNTKERCNKHCINK